jgi:AcrR family transcriptional regulator
MTTKATTKPDLGKEEAILAAAVHVFAREGFRGADVQEIADRAGVGKGTVYRRFGDKQELFWGTAFWVLDKLDQHLTQAVGASDSPLEKLRATCRAYGEFFESNPEYLEIFVLDRAEFRGAAPPPRRERHEKMIAEFGKIVEAGIAAGEIRPVNAREVVLSLGSTLYGSVVCAAMAAADRSLTEMAEYAADIFLRGIYADESHSGPEQ